MDQQILGLHHVTAIGGEPQTNIDFYAGVLGLRLIKLTVNFDDPTTYHLYYGDGQGHPGTILTFFPWPGAMHGRVGTGQLTLTSFAVPERALDYWQQRLREHSIDQNESRSFQTSAPSLSWIRTVYSWNSSVRRMQTPTELGSKGLCQLISRFGASTM